MAGILGDIFNLLHAMHHEDGVCCCEWWACDGPGYVHHSLQVQQLTSRAVAMPDWDASCHNTSYGVSVEIWDNPCGLAKSQTPKKVNTFSRSPHQCAGIRLGYWWDGCPGTWRCDHFYSSFIDEEKSVQSTSIPIPHHFLRSTTNIFTMVTLRDRLFWKHGTRKGPTHQKPHWFILCLTTYVQLLLWIRPTAVKDWVDVVLGLIFTVTCTRSWAVEHTTLRDFTLWIKSDWWSMSPEASCRWRPEYQGPEV